MIKPSENKPVEEKTWTYPELLETSRELETYKTNIDGNVRLTKSGICEFLIKKKAISPKSEPDGEWFVIYYTDRPNYFKDLTQKISLCSGLLARKEQREVEHLENSI